MSGHSQRGLRHISEMNVLIQLNKRNNGTETGWAPAGYQEPCLGLCSRGLLSSWKPSFPGGQTARRQGLGQDPRPSPRAEGAPLVAVAERQAHGRRGALAGVKGSPQHPEPPQVKSHWGWHWLGMPQSPWLLPHTCLCAAPNTAWLVPRPVWPAGSACLSPRVAADSGAFTWDYKPEQLSQDPQTPALGHSPVPAPHPLTSAPLLNQGHLSSGPSRVPRVAYDLMREREREMIDRW